MRSESQQSRIGSIIKDLRVEQGITQNDLAQSMGTSQSAIARIESGGQNLSTKELIKLSVALKHPIVSLSNNETDDYEIFGGKKLSGTAITNPSKNGAIALLCASLLNKAETILHNIPQIEEIHRMKEVLNSIGVEAKFIDKHSISIKPSREIFTENINLGSAGAMRSTIMLMGPLSFILPDFKLPHSGGCKMGKRTIAAHKHALESFGIKIKTHDDNYTIKTKKHKPGQFTMYEASDTATENALMAASKIEGESIIYFAQQNYMVQDVIGFLKALGANIKQSGVATLTINGQKEYNQKIEYYNSEDPIESMAFITAAIVTQSQLTVSRCPIEFLRLEILKLQKMGQKFKISKPYLSKNGFTKLVDIEVIPSKLKALNDKIHALPYPGINIDNLPFFVPIATQAEGNSLIHDWTWENRALYYTELNRMGADIKLADPHRVFISGKTELKAAQIVCPPALRPSVIILIAMLGAPGKSILRNVYAIKRGYENIVSRLNDLGADVSLLVDI